MTMNFRSFVSASIALSAIAAQLQSAHAEPPRPAARGGATPRSSAVRSTNGGGGGFRGSAPAGGSSRASGSFSGGASMGGRSSNSSRSGSFNGNATFGGGATVGGSTDRRSGNAARAGGSFTGSATMNGGASRGNNYGVRQPAQPAQPAQPFTPGNMGSNRGGGYSPTPRAGRTTTTAIPGGRGGVSVATSTTFTPPRYPSGSTLRRNSRAELRFANDGSRALYRRDIHGQERLRYNQVVLANGGFSREYYDPFTGRTVVRGYAPVAWGVSGPRMGVRFNVFRPAAVMTWNLGRSPVFARHPSFGAWCQSDLSDYNAFYNYGWDDRGYSTNVRWRSYAHYTTPSQWLVDFYLGNVYADYYELRARELQANRQLQAQMAARQFALDAQMRELVNMQARMAMMQIQNQNAVSVGTYIDQYNDNYNQRMSGQPATRAFVNHVYVVSEPTSTFVQNQHGQMQGCTLQPGDLIQQAAQMVFPEGQVDPSYKPTAQMKVVKSQNDSCQSGSVVPVELEDLQEFENDFYAGVEQGMSNLNQQFWQGR